MHPILHDRIRLLLYLIGWLLVGALLALSLGRAGTWVLAVTLFVPLSLAHAFIALSAWYVCRALPVHAHTVWRTAFTLVVGAATSSAVWVAIGRSWADLIDTFRVDGAARRLAVERSPELLMVGALLFLLAATASYLLMAFEHSREREARAMELTVLAREAELRALRAQMNPHFLYNSLHSISALTTADSAAARRMCILVADFLRATIRMGATDRIPLSDEFELADRFLAIERVRLGSRLSVTLDGDASARDCLVPALLLQPVVENAVVHGVGQLVDGGAVTIVASRADGMVVIVVANPCDPDRVPRQGSGLGLDMLRRRLTAQYGEAGTVVVREGHDAFRVEIRLPAETVAPLRQDRG